MSERWPGSLISPTAPVPSGGGAQDSAPGVWTLDQAAPYIATNNWPGLGTPDPQFQYVTALLHGDGTNGAQNNTFLDSSSNNFTITRNGNLTQGSFSPYGSLWSNYFNGSNQYITSPSSSAYTLGSSGDFTIDGWFYMTSDGGGIYPIITNYNNWDTGYSNRFYLGFSGNVFRWYNSAGSTAISTSSYSLNKWNYFNFTRSGSTITGYLNGNIIGTQTTSQDYTTDDVLRIAGSMGNGNYFNGYVSNVRIIKGATVSGTTVPTSPATAVSGTTFLSCQSNRFIDNSSNNFTLTAGNSPSVQRFSPLQNLATYQTTKIGGSSYSDGGNSNYLSVPSNSAFNLGTGEFTIEFWMYLTAFPWYEMLVGRQNYFNNTGWGVWIKNDAGNAISLFLNGAATIITGAVPPLNAWQHVAVVRDSSNVITIYQNGVATASSSVPSFTDSSNNLNIGANDGSSWNGSYPVNGYMSDVRIVKGTCLYNSAFTPPTAPLTNVTNTSFLENYTNGAIYDNAELNDLQTVGDAQISTSVYKYGTGSLKFDGSGDYLLGAVNQNQAFGTGNFTIEFWMYPTATTDCYVVANLNGSGSAPNNSWGLYLTSGQIPQFTTYFSVLITGSQAVPLNTWSHFAITRAGSTIMLFLNGNMIGSASNSTDFSSTNALRVGAHSSGTSPYTGYVDDLRITKGYCRYWYNFVPPSAAYPNYGGTVALLPYDPQFNSNTLLLNGEIVNGNTSTFITDASTNNFVVSPNGSPSNAPQNPFQAGYYSNSFNGSSYLSLPNNTGFDQNTPFTFEFFDNLSSNGSTQSCFYTLTNGYLTILRTSSGGYSLNKSYVGDLYITGNYSFNTWHHVAVSYDGTNTRFYVDGMLQYTMSGGGVACGAAPQIGAAAGGSNAVGYISNFRFVKSALYTGSTLTVPTAPLTAVSNTSCLTCQSNSFIDNSANAFAITATGSPTVSQNQPFTYTTPVTYASGYFNGSASYLTSATTGSSLAFGTGDFTVEAWVYWPSSTSGTTQYIMDWRTAGICCFGLNLGGVGAYLEWFNGTSTIGASAIPPSGTWVHCVAVRSGTTLSVYQNGTRVGTGSDSTNYTGSAITATIGARYTLGSVLNGYMSNLRIVKGTAVYDPTQSTLTVPTAPLTAVSGTQLLTVQNNVPATNSGFLDSSPNAFAITRNGNTTQGSFSPYGSLWSNQYNGSSDYFTVSAGSSFAFGTGDFTVEAFVFLTANPQYSYVIDARNGSQTSTWSFDWGYNGTANKLGWGSSGSGILFEPGTGIVPLNQWTHIAYTRFGTTGSLYVNGARIATTTDSNNYSTAPTTSYIGTRFGLDATTFFPGYMMARVNKGTALYTGATYTIPTSFTAVSGTVLLVGTSNRFIDASSNNYTLTVGGSPSVQRFSPFNPTSTYSTSVIGGSGYFNGSTDYLLTPSSSLISNFSGDFTIEGWVYLNTATSYAVLVGGDGSNGWYVEYSSNRGFGAYDGSSFKSGSSSAVTGQWVHYAVTRASGTLRFFINGANTATTTSSGFNYTQALGISAYSGGSSLINGYQSDIRINNTTALYTSSFTPPTSPLTAVSGTQLLTNMTNAGIPDLAMQNDLQTVGSAQVSTAQYKYGSSSLSFDGSTSYILSTANTALYSFGSGDFTIEFWVNFNSTSGNPQIISFNPTSTNGAYPLIYIGGSTTFAYYVNNSEVITGTTVPTTGVWYHVAITRTGTSTRLFVNGNQEGSTYSDSNSYLCGTNRPVIGCGGYNLLNKMNGYIDDLRITKGLARYVQPFTPPTAALPTY